MIPAAWPRSCGLLERLMVVDPARDRCEVATVGDLSLLLSAGDLLVVNDSATLPASLRGTTARAEPVEIRLLSSRSSPDRAWRAILFGAGDWRTRTEDRPAPPRVHAGDVLSFGADLRARVESVDPNSERLVEVRFLEQDRFWSALYRYGRPVQYAHVAAPLELWHVQTPFAARPWSSEMPSAARPLAWELLLAVLAKGVRVASLTHAAGLSSTGDAQLDARLPLRESFDVPASTAQAIDETRARRGRVVAVGTTVVRALESAVSEEGRVIAGAADTEATIGPGHRLRAVDAILTGMHEPGTSHDALLRAFAPRDLLTRAFRAATKAGFLGHEFGDSMLVGRGLLPETKGLEATRSGLRREHGEFAWVDAAAADRPLGRRRGGRPRVVVVCQRPGQRRLCGALEELKVVAGEQLQGRDP